MKKSFLALLLIFSFLLAGCNPFSNIFANPFGGGGGDDDDNDSAQPSRVIEPTEKFSLAIGGVASGRDELVIYNDLGDVMNIQGELICIADDENIVEIQPRPDFETTEEGSGVQLVALAPGVTAITCAVGDVALEGIYEITVPPQSLIQILLAEGGMQIADEATIDTELGENVVALTSESPTGNALAWVIRNRIELINYEENPGLFNANEDKYYSDPTASYYEEVIWAEDQFSPTSRDDPTHDIFLDAEERDDLEGDWLIAYDQAVITAAGVFNGDIVDLTAGAFAFRSPTDAEWDLLAEALSDGAAEIPDDSGFTDASFPALAPIQILVHPDVWTYDDGLPSFVFARERLDGYSAMTNNP